MICPLRTMAGLSRPAAPVAPITMSAVFITSSSDMGEPPAFSKISMACGLMSVPTIRFTP